MRYTRIPSENPIPLRLKQLEDRVDRLLAAVGAPYVPVTLNEPTTLTATDGQWHQLLTGTAAGPGSWQVHLVTSNTLGARVRLLVDNAVADDQPASGDLLLSAQLPPTAEQVVVSVEGLLYGGGPLVVTVLDSRTIAGGSS